MVCIADPVDLLHRCHHRNWRTTRCCCASADAGWMPARRTSYVPSKAIASSTQHRYKPEFELIASCLLLVMFGLFYHYVEFTRVIHEHSQNQDVAGLPIQDSQMFVSDSFTEEIVQLCMSRRHAMLYIPHHAPGRVHATESYDKVAQASHCPTADILLEPDDRSIGLCTDAALYMQLFGSRLFASAAALPPAYAAACINSTARLFLEPLYESWFSPGAVHVHLPNFENMVASDRQLHARLDLVLCKVQRCVQLVAPYLSDLGSNARVMYVGHTSVDPLHRHRHRLTRSAAAHVRPSATAAQRHLPHLLLRRSRIRRHQMRAGLRPPVLHVRGKSSLKHSRELLECWLSHPEWPQLVFVGPLPNPQVNTSLTKAVQAAGNIRVLASGPVTGPNWPEFQPLRPHGLSHLQQSTPLHVCPSEREGFGHYINEARAAGAVVIAPDHPPMNELVNATTGVLIRVNRTFSQPGPPEPALGRYGHISASVSPQDICDAVAAALSLAPDQRAALGLAARAAFDAERAAFLDRAAAAELAVEEALMVKARSSSQQQQQQQQQTQAR